MSDNTRYVMLFGGQGSTSIFSPSTAATAEGDALATNAGNALLSRCHAAFLEDMSSLDNDSRRKLNIDLASFPSPSNLLRPPSKYHTHPVFQATTIFLSQLLHYLAETNRQAQKDGEEYSECVFENIQETAGFSSGILPAAVVSLSQTVQQLVACGVEAFRLAFWIAARTQLYQLDHHDEAKGVEQGDDETTPKTKSPTLSLVIRGLSQTELTTRIAQYNSRKTTDLSISAITSPTVISASGPKHELEQFRKNLVADVATTFAFVHGWYHGAGLQFLVEQVLEDCRRRGISLPISSKTRPIRSTRDGSLLHPDGSTNSQHLLKWLANHLLVHCVDWCCTTRAMAESINRILDKDKTGNLAFKIMSFGPSSSSLFPPQEAATSANPRIHLVDLSPFKPGAAPIMSPSSLFNVPAEQHKDSIAIVGMSVNLPLGQSPAELWSTLSNGLSAVSPIPSSRFTVSSTTNPTTSPKTGCFLPDSQAFSFDNTFFSLSPRESRSMDPQQRVLLTCAHNALSDAGYVPDSSPAFQRSSFGCYVGLATGDYVSNLNNTGTPDDKSGIDVYYSTGTLRAFHSGRISYFYKWSGPSIVTDTACSSSMVSIYQAVRALQAGDCRAALAGGVNIMTAPEMYLGLGRGHFLSKSGGGCRPFDQSADGYTRAEGCVLFVLKRVQDAVEEGDKILGVIRGVEVNQSGGASSITHPCSKTQGRLFEKLLGRVGVSAESVGVVEAHGTGTQAGDAREVESLAGVFGGRKPEGKVTFLGSIKGSIGHCEAASGAAGLAKLLLMMKERQIPPQAGFETVNPALKRTLESAGFVISTRLVPWRHQLGTPRRALLNNFGAAGSNGSLLLEDWVPPVDDAKEAKDRSAYLFALSAKSGKALRWSVEEHVRLLSGPEPPLIKDVCYTSTARRQVYDHRIAMSCSSVPDLVAKLKQYQEMDVSTTKPAPKVSKVVFAFAGQGSWSDGVGRELLDTFPSFRDIIKECDKIITSLDEGGFKYPSIIGFLLQENEQWSDSDRIVASQCACVALQIALARTFISCGIEPDYVLGHSLGEYAALHIAGVLSLHVTLLVVAVRSRLMTEKCLAGTSGMLACNLSAEKAQQVILSRQHLAQLSVACQNSPADCVVGGPVEQLSQFQAGCKEARSKMLHVPFAFHTSSMDPILDSLQELGRRVKFGQPEIPVLSNVHGRFLEGKDLDSSYFALHARQRVRFADMLECLQHKLEQEGATAAGGEPLFMDIGPHPTTLPMLRASLVTSPNNVYLGTLQKGKQAWKSMTESLAAVCLRKLPKPVNWRPIFAGTSARVTSLPAHLLEGPTYLVPYQEPGLLSRKPNPVKNPDPDPRIRTGFYLLPWVHPSPPGADGLVLETDLTILGPLISGHDVGGSCICPASVFHELAIEAADVMLRPQAPQVPAVQGMRFASPLVYVPSVSQEETTATTTLVLVRITRSGEAETRFKITSRCAHDTSAKETEHCSGSISVQSLHPGSKQWARDEAMVSRQSRHFSHVGDISTFRPKVLYEAVFTRVVRYAAEYQSLTHLDVADSNLEGLGRFQVPSSPGFGSEAAADGYLTHPVFTDTLLHAAGFIANLHMALDSEPMIGICARVESIEIAYRDIDVSKGVFTIYCSLLEIDGGKAILADTVVLNEAGKVVAVVRGIEFKRLRLPAFQAALARHGGDATTAAVARKRNPVLVSTAIDVPLESGIVNSPITASTSSTSTDSPAPGVDANFVRTSVRDIVVEVGGFQGQEEMSTVLSTKSLDELGIDSMMRIEVAAKLSHVFPGQGLDHHALESCDTIEEMQEMVLMSLSATATAPRPGIVTPPTPEVQLPESPPPESSCEMPFTTSFSTRPEASSQSHQNTVKAMIKDLVIEVGGFQMSPDLEQVLATRSLDELGIDSMMRIEIAGKLAQVLPSRHGHSLDHHALEDCNTLQEMQAVVLAAVGPTPQEQLAPARSVHAAAVPVSDSGYHSISGRSTSLPSSQLQVRSNPVTLHRAPPTAVTGKTIMPAPLCLFHDGSGQTTPSSRLTFQYDRTTYAFFDPSFGLPNGPTKRPFTSIAQMAGRYISLLIPNLEVASSNFSREKNEKKRAIILGGWSFGGVVAFEAAKQLLAQHEGYDVKGLVLIDSPSPVDHEPLPEAVIDNILGTKLKDKAANAAMKQEFMYNASLLGKYKPSPSEIKIKTVMLQSRELFGEELEKLGVRYDWLSKQESRTKALKDWQMLTGGGEVQVLDIPGNHFQAFDKGIVDETSKQVWEACRIIGESSA